MKKFNEILEDIRSLSAEISALNQQIEAESDAYAKKYRGLTLKEKIEEKREEEEVPDLEQKICDLNERLVNLKIKMLILRNNAKIALFHEVMPTALEVFRKYEGKPYGPKTEEKISNEILKLTGSQVYISAYYSNHLFHISPEGYSGYGVDCGTKVRDGKEIPILTGNRIAPVSMEDLELHYIPDRYMEDPDMAVREIRQLHGEAREKLREFREACNRFNEMTVEGMTRLTFPYYLPEIINVL